MEMGAIQHCVYTGPRQGDISQQSSTLWTLSVCAAVLGSFLWRAGEGECSAEEGGFTFGCSGDKTCFVLSRGASCRWGPRAAARSGWLAVCFHVLHVRQKARKHVQMHWMSWWAQLVWAPRDSLSPSSLSLAVPLCLFFLHQRADHSSLSTRTQTITPRL